MDSWRDRILNEFSPKVARLTLVADPDGLLLEEDVLAGIQERGYELFQFEDHARFRYAYESKFRSLWDQGKPTDLTVALRSADDDLSYLPYDLLQASRQLFFSLGELFPKMSYPVVASLDKGDLEALYQAQQTYSPDLLGDNATKEFILRHVYEIAPELIKSPAELLRVLLRRHYRGERIPALLDEYFIQILRQTNRFNDWPLELIVTDRDVFFSFLQERWPVFLDRLTSEEGQGLENQSDYHLEFSGPPELPFEHDDVRVYIDNLFVEGMLNAVPHEKSASLTNSWASIGIQSDTETDRFRRFYGLLETAESSIPSDDSRYGEWIGFTKVWAELIFLGTELDESELIDASERIEAVQFQLDLSFTAWLKKRFAGLINLPPVPPVMLHHIPRFLARRLGEADAQKAALVLVDGLSFDQWISIREILNNKQAEFRFHEDAVFAWAPTLTSVSRQAAFAGKPPIYFPASITKTDREPILWKQFWEDQGITQHEVSYLKGLGDGKLGGVEELVANPKTRVIGLVIDTVDKIMHGMELGGAGMHNQIRQWAGQSFLSSLFDLLLKHGFSIFLTSDHGNIEAQGCGQPSEGAAADLRGERVRVYTDQLLRRKIHSSFPEAILWDPAGLPDEYLPLFAPAREAFVKQGRVVSHGGISLEELVVPFVQIEKKRNG